MVQRISLFVRLEQLGLCKIIKGLARFFAFVTQHRFTDFRGLIPICAT